MVTGEFLLYFDDPFWVGLFLRTDETGAYAARHVFGGEPGYPEIREFLVHDYESLNFLRIEDSEMESLIRKQNRLSQRQVRKNRSEIPRSLEIYKTSLQQEKQSRKSDSGRNARDESREQYRKKRERAKQKKRGR